MSFFSSLGQIPDKGKEEVFILTYSWSVQSIMVGVLGAAVSLRSQSGDRKMNAGTQLLLLFSLGPQSLGPQYLGPQPLMVIPTPINQWRNSLKHVL